MGVKRIGNYIINIAEWAARVGLEFNDYTK